MTTEEWVARKWGGVRTSSAFIALASLVVGGFLLLHVWSYGSDRGATGICAAVISVGRHSDTVLRLDIPPETATEFCNQQRSQHAREGVAALVFGGLALSFSVWAHTQSIRAVRVGMEEA